MSIISELISKKTNDAIQSITSKKEQLLKTRLNDLGLRDRVENPERYKYAKKKIFTVNYNNQWTEYRYGTSEDFISIIRFYPLVTSMNEEGGKITWSLNYQ